MNIVVTIDNRFVMPCGVLFQSICVNNKDCGIHFFIITDSSFSEKNKNLLTETIKKYNAKNQLDFYYVDPDEVRVLMNFKDGFYTVHVFYRLFIANLLPNDVDKVLFLDGDIIVRHSLKNLWKIDLSRVALGACQDAHDGRIEQFNRLCYSSVLGYFNAGVLLINLKYWREHNLLQSCLAFVGQYPERIVLNDQDILNYLCRESKVEIPLKYNVQSDYLFKPKYLFFDVWRHHDEWIEAINDPVILHFSGDRPWEEGCKHPYKDEFFKYRNETIWKNEPLWPERKSFKTRLIDILRPIGAKLGVCHIIPDYYDRSLKLQ